MGVGIATAVLMTGRGHPVTLVDTKERQAGQQTTALARADAEVKANLALLEELGALPRQAQALAVDLRVATGLKEGVAGRSFVFEALPEKVAIKQEFYRTIGAFIDADTVVASATSTFYLDVFWQVCSRPGNVVSAHWLNPAFLIPLVEVAHGEKTHLWALDKICAFLRAIGKIPVKLKTSPGFIVPRIQAAAMNEAVRLLEEGVTTAEEIDTAIKAGFGFRLGVLGLIEFVDLGGVDILFQAGDYLYNTLGGSHFMPPKLVKEKMDRSEIGPRAGKGFYDYHGVDIRALFNKRYMGFVELLRLYQQSTALNFAGGIAADKPLSINPNPTE
jgi:3-hydroxybutyryl-CoA dehydrogenase